MKSIVVCSLLLALIACSTPTATPSNDQTGLDCKHAILVKTVAEEYQWVKAHFPGCKFLSQSLSSCPGYPVDILKIRTSDGSEKSIYFNIKIVMEEEEKMFNIK